MKLFTVMVGITTENGSHIVVTLEDVTSKMSLVDLAHEAVKKVTATKVINVEIIYHEAQETNIH